MSWPEVVHDLTVQGNKVSMQYRPYPSCQHCFFWIWLSLIILNRIFLSSYFSSFQPCFITSIWAFILSFISASNEFVSEQSLKNCHVFLFKRFKWYQKKDAQNANKNSNKNCIFIMYLIIMYHFTKILPYQSITSHPVSLLHLTLL